MDQQATTPRSILIVEDWAHVRNGHFPRRFADLAGGFVELGCRVEVLTSRGWLHADEETTASFTVHRYGRLVLRLDRLASRLRDRHGEQRAAALARSLGSSLRVFAIIASARAIRRRIVPPADVIVLSYAIDFPLAAAIAGPGRWLFYAFDPPPGSPPRRRRFVERLGSSAERRRRDHGGGARIAASYDDCRRLWAERAPVLEPTVLPIAGCRLRAPIPGARQQLGIASEGRLALMFGASSDKNLDAVCRAFADLDEWQLLICGRVADSYDPKAQPRTGQEPVVMAGFVSNGTRDLAYAAADLAVLSFHANYQRNSGTLFDAISWGVPVVCSEHSAAAELVRRYRLGVTFSPGDPHSLADAVRRAPARIEQEDLDRAREELSNRAVAARHLQLLQHFGDRRGWQLPVQ